MKKRGYREYSERPRRKRRRGTIIAILLIVAALIYIYFSKGGLINLPGFSLSNSNTLIQTCNQNVMKCGSVIESKYEATLTILESVKVNTTLGANEFLKTWGPASQVSDINSYGDSFPVVLIATRMNNPDGTKTPHVFVCKSDGTLDELSTSGLC